MSTQAATPPESLCLLRTSALGDVSHVVPLVRTVQSHWPNAALTWIVGKLEHRLVGDLPGVEFIVFDKSQGRNGYRAVHRALVPLDRVEAEQAEQSAEVPA